MLNDYLSDLRLLEMLGLIMLGLTLLWTTISGISSLIQHWRAQSVPMPRHLFRPMTVRISSGTEGGKSPINEKCRFRILPVGANRRLYNACRANGK